MACTLLLGVFNLQAGRSLANAAEKKTTATFSTDLATGKISKGKSFKFIASFNTERELNLTNKVYWASVSLRIGLVKVEIPNPTEGDDSNVDVYEKTLADTGVPGSVDSFVYEVTNPAGGAKVNVAQCFSVKRTEDDDSIIEMVSPDNSLPESLNGKGYANSCRDDFAVANSTGTSNYTPGNSFLLSLSSEGTGNRAQSVKNPANVELTINVADSEDLPAGRYTFGILGSTISDLVSFGNSTESLKDVASTASGKHTDNGNLEVGTVSVVVSDASDDATLVSVDVGQGDDTNPMPAEDGFETLDWGTDPENPTTPTYKITGSDLTKVVFKPKANDAGATMKIGFSATEDTGESSTDVPVDPTDGATITVPVPTTGTSQTVYIHVTAEDGTTKKSYPVILEIAYVRLSNLTGACDTGTLTGVTKNGVSYNEKYDETSSGWVLKDAANPVTSFDPDQKIWRVYVPSNAGRIDLTPTVIDHFGANTSIALAKDTDASALKITDIPADADTAANEITSIASGTAFRISDIPVDTETALASGTFTVKLTVTANDGTTTEESTLKLQIVSVVTAIDTFTVTGISNNTYTNDTSKVTEGTAPDYADRVDYYFSMDQETAYEDDSGTPIAVGKMIVALKQSGAKVYVRVPDAAAGEGATKDVEFTASDTHIIGKHTLVVKSEAGNEETFIVVLAKPDVLQLMFDSNYQFLFRRLLREGSGEYLRTAYDEEEIKYVHGVDDKDFDRIVLGQILPSTSVKGFMDNIPAQLHKFVRLYGKVNGTNTLIFDRENGAVDAETFDKADRLPVATGWHIEFGADADHPTDIIYLAVFGDTDGDGLLGANDSGNINSYITGTPEEKAAWTEEFLLAAYVAQTGGIGAADASAINAMIVDPDGFKIEDYFTYINPAAQPNPGRKLSVDFRNVSANIIFRSERGSWRAVYCLQDQCISKNIKSVLLHINFVENRL